MRGLERLALLDTSYHPLSEGEAGETERAGRMSLLATARRDGMRTMAREWALGMVHPSRHDTPLFEAVLDMFDRKTPDIFAAQINALLQRPDVFKAGVSGAPVVDWADYDTHYTERYMGLPDENVAGYRHSNVLTHADLLDGKLLLVHGTADDDVYFQHSVKLADALFRNGQTFEFLPLRGLTHMTPEPIVNQRLHQRMLEHFTEHLKPASP